MTCLLVYRLRKDAHTRLSLSGIMLQNVSRTKQ